MSAGAPEKVRRIRALQAELSELWSGQDSAVTTAESGEVVVLPLRVGDRWLAVPVVHVNNVMEACWLAPTNNHHGWLAGAFQLQGELVRVVDLRRSWGEPPTPLSATDRFVRLHSVQGLALLAQEVRVAEVIASAHVRLWNDVAKGVVWGSVSVSGVEQGLLSVERLDAALRLVDEAQ